MRMKYLILSSSCHEEKTAEASMICILLLNSSTAEEKVESGDKNVKEDVLNSQREELQQEIKIDNLRERERER